MKALILLMATIVASFSNGFMNPMVRSPSFMTRNKGFYASQMQICNRSASLQAAPSKNLLDQALVNLTKPTLFFDAKSHAETGDHGNFDAPEEEYRSSVRILEALERVRKAFDKGAKPEEQKLLDGILEKVRSRAIAEESKQSTDNIADGADKILINLIQVFCSEVLLPAGSFETMLKDEAELVHFSDRAPTKECVSAVTVNKVTNCITVVFRGSVNIRDWNTNVKLTLDEHDHRITDFDGVDKIGIHFGFYEDLFDPTRRPSKFQEIMDEIGLYYQEGWRVAVTGHSLGAALATLFGFYCAADGRFNQCEPVEVYSFASPFVGDARFSTAFRHLEKTGKLAHARFCHDHDLVPHLPNVSPKLYSNGAPTFDVSMYKHVGLEIKLKLDEEPALVRYQFKDRFGAEDAKQFVEQVGAQVADRIKLNLPSIEVLSIENGQKMLGAIKERYDQKPTGLAGLVGIDLGGLKDLDTEALAKEAAAEAMSRVTNLFQRIAGQGMKMADRGFKFLEFHKLTEYRQQIIDEVRTPHLDVTIQHYYVRENIME